MKSGIAERSIIVIEDSDEDFEITTWALKDAGVVNPVYRCANTSAIAQLWTETPHCPNVYSATNPLLILLDLNLPGSDWHETLQKLRTDYWWRAVPVIVVSTSSHPATVLACYSLGAAGYIQKELDLDKFSRALKNLSTYWLDTVVLPVPRDENEAFRDTVTWLKHPSLVSAYLLWRAVSNGPSPPRMADLNWGGLPDAEHTFTVKVERSGENVNFRFLTVGRALIARLGRPLEGTSVTTPDPYDAGSGLVGSLATSYQQCAETLSPSYEFARYDFGDGDPVWFERLILPVSDDGEHVTHLVGVALFSGDTQSMGTIHIS